MTTGHVTVPRDGPTRSVVISEGVLHGGKVRVCICNGRGGGAHFPRVGKKGV